jgi:class 3 adenylate cyclase/predicted ATPase
MDLGAWLCGLGLERYEQAFRDNDISMDLLATLNADDLREIGVGSLGHRKQLLSAIAALVGTTDSKALPAAVMAGPSPHAERRQLTVMFVDLVGSTALASKLDPEVMREVILGYQNAVAGEVVRFEGHIAKFMGDGVLAYFGWPRAHEDEAERAVRAGLALVEAIPKLAMPDNEPLSARVGIATGLVVVGDLIGEGAAQEQAVVGEAPNLAARLQALAEPGTVVIASETRRQIGRLFELASCGDHHLKGFDKLARAWRVLGEGTADSRFEALHGERITPLVGREHEIGILLERFDRARYGEGQVVLLSGEPGIGKSRIVRALGERLGMESYISVNHFCSPFHTNSPFYPVISLLKRAAGFRREDASETMLEKLESLLSKAGADIRDSAPLMAALLSIETGERYPLLKLAPDAQKQRTLEALVNQLVGLSSRRPVLAVFEDVHWIDPSTLDLLDLIVDHVQRLAVLVLVTFRSKFAPTWIGRGHVTSLSLGRLGRRQGTSMIDTMTGGKDLPTEVLDQIVTKTDGVPLFIEELTKSLLESGLMQEGKDRYVLARPLPPLAIPATLHDSLLARLDRLGPAKETAELGAALGREFSYELLAAVSELEERKLQNALAQLASAELIFCRGRPPDAIYAFKHPLVQDAAYARLLKSRRQQLHSRIAQVLRQRFPDRVAAEPELLAHHYTEAGEIEQATDAWLAAGQRAVERSSNVEAVAHLRRGLDLIERLPDGVERAQREIALQIALGTPLMGMKGYGAPEVGVAYARARELCDHLGDTSQLLPILYGQTVFHIVNPETRMGRPLTEEFLRVAEDQGKMGPALVARRVLGFSQWQQGELVSSRTNLQQVCDLYAAERDRGLYFQHGQDPQPTAMAVLSLVSWLLGDVDKAMHLRQEAIALGRATAHANTLAYAQTFAGCVLGAACRDWSSAAEHGAAVLKLAEQRRLPTWHAWAKFYHTRALAEVAPTEALVAQMREALVEVDATGTRNTRTFHLALLAEVHGKLGQTAKALDVIGDALARVEETDERWWEAEAHRLKGELLLSLSTENASEVEACFRQATAIAISQHSKSLELRAAISHARLWQGMNENGKARALLMPVYCQLATQVETADLIDARTVLDKLGQGRAVPGGEVGVDTG